MEEEIKIPPQLHADPADAKAHKEDNLEASGSQETSRNPSISPRKLYAEYINSQALIELRDELDARAANFTSLNQSPRNPTQLVSLLSPISEAI